MQVFIERDFARDTYNIYVREVYGSKVRFFQANGLCQYETEVANAFEPDSNWREGRFASLPVEAASPLFKALADLLGAVEHPEQLRKDYEHERGRVDKLLDHLIDVDIQTRHIVVEEMKK